MYSGDPRTHQNLQRFRLRKLIILHFHIPLPAYLHLEVPDQGRQISRLPLFLKGEHDTPATTTCGLLSTTNCPQTVHPQVPTVVPSNSRSPGVWRGTCGVPNLRWNPAAAKCSLPAPLRLSASSGLHPSTWSLFRTHGLLHLFAFNRFNPPLSRRLVPDWLVAPTPHVTSEWLANITPSPAPVPTRILIRLLLRFGRVRAAYRVSTGIFARQRYREAGIARGRDGAEKREGGRDGQRPNRSIILSGWPTRHPPMRLRQR